MKVIGLTGSSGSGKSSAAGILADLGARVIDADRIAREVVARDDALGELKGAFGDRIIDGNGAFNRAFASKRAFTDKGFLARLTEITHKYIINEIYARVDGLKREIGGADAGIIVIDAPIPVEKGFLDLADEVWVVCAPREIRLERVIGRDKISADDAEARFSSQLPDGAYERLADVLIDNGGGPADLKDRITAEILRLRAPSPH